MGASMIVFVQDLCPYSEMATTFLKVHHVPHVIRNTSTDFEARREFIRLGAEMLPTFIIGGRMYVGYDPRHLRVLIQKELGIDIPEEAAKIPKKRFKRLMVRDPELFRKVIVPMSTGSK